MKGPNYQAWEIDESGFPSGAGLEQQLRFLARYGVLAPSTHNSQPWLFRVENDLLQIIPNKQLLLPQSDPTTRDLFISLGACAANIMVAADHFGLHATYGVNNDTEMPIIEIRVATNKTEVHNNGWGQLFSYITQRYSNKRTEHLLPINEDVKHNLEMLNPTGKARLVFMPGGVAIANLYYQAAASFNGDRAFGRELSNWLTGNRSRRYDGMPGFTTGLSNPKALIGKTLVKYVPKSIRILAKKYRSLLKVTSVIGLVITDNDSVSEWIESGILYERFALHATSLGVSVTPLAAVIEKDEYRKQLAEHLKITEGKIQMFLRVVMSNEKALHTPRREPIFI